MGKVLLTLEDGLEEKFREKATVKFGFKKGNLSQAAEEAFKDWLAKK